jgi:hypothetical protein
MAQLGQVFEASALPQGTSYDPLPAGWYSAKITGAELKNTKANDGQYLEVKYGITGPTHQGRIVFERLNIRNQNTKAVEIAMQSLGDLIRAIGIHALSDSDQLLGHDLQIKLDVRKQEGYEPSNDVKGHKAAGAGSAPVFAAPASKQSASPDAPSAAPQKAAPPWAKK